MQQHRSDVGRSARRLVQTSLLLAASILASCAGTDRGGDASTPATDARPEAVSKWIPLFDGESLAGWTPKIVGLAAGEDPLRTFRVEDGLLTVSYDGYGDGTFDGRFGHLFHELELSHYVLRAEYRFVGEQMAGAPGWAYRNSGLMIHGERPDQMGLDQAFPVSIEVQLLGEAPLGEGRDDERPNGNLCTPGTHVVMGEELVTRHCTDADSPRTYRGDEWVTIEVEVHGNGEIVHRLEGRDVLRYSHAQYDTNDADGRRLAEAAGDVRIDRGTISIQSESFPIQFRSIAVRPLEQR
ncbi:hypothetical protein Pla163_03280 [Planctomycetes bacterium Pla163]|uniref:3-keto-alpha-glucoside-1,2-lyase/3-keto-2-hydroxy-glucal hydratase domain-containing protein n=1 Tax=Rohdeia mirabilis TaxID=2528008 RepID=A0A518CVI2_9BACT|nr:hypothetical protein Pla163_03280 [Planctomycetes bacterium Pla163]